MAPLAGPDAKELAVIPTYTGNQLVGGWPAGCLLALLGGGCVWLWGPRGACRSGHGPWGELGVSPAASCMPASAGG